MKKLRLKKLNIKELKDKELKVTQELSETRFNVRIGQDKDYSVISKKRKELAVIKTLLKEAELGLHIPPSEKEINEDKKIETKKVKKAEEKTETKKTDIKVKVQKAKKESDKK